MSDFDNMLAAMGHVPKLAGAACRGQWATFDPAETGEDPADTATRHQAALTVCRSCTALADCRQWVDSTPQRYRPLGVIAGQINEPKKRRHA